MSRQQHWITIPHPTDDIASSVSSSLLKFKLVDVNPDSSLRYIAIELRTKKVLLQVNALVDSGASE
jgi:hypothetical protein